VPYTERIFKHDIAFDFLFIFGTHLTSCCIEQIPLCHIPEPVIKTAGDWISQRSSDALGDFVLWCIDSIMSELSGPAAGTKGSKKVVQHSPRAQVMIIP
jgi:hypothetical protein